MKKLLVLSALAAVSTAFVACSSNDDLVQQAPEVPQTKGTPFSVSIQNGTDTRATLYNADAWNKTNTTTWVNAFKLYGKQASNDPWMNNVVFARSAYNADWVADRSAAEATINPADLTWPVADKTTPTSFYAITDGAIGTGTTAAIAGVSEWMSTPGSFTYTQPTTTDEFEWDSGNYTFENVTDSHVSTASLTDLMVATTTKAESETTGGVLPLNFKHLLAGLSIQVKFESDDALDVASTATIYAVMVRGLYTSGTYSFATGWSNHSGDGICYYKQLATPINIAAVAEGSHQVPLPLVNAGEWLVIPQTTTPWDETTDKTTFPGLKSGRQMAYVALYITDNVTGDDLVVYYPLNTTFNASKNRTITIELSLGRDIWLDTNNDGKADYQFEPSQTDAN